MSRERTLIKPSGDDEARLKRAHEAVRMFRMMMPSLNGYARAITGKADVRVQPSRTGYAYTNGKVIYVPPPMQLADKTPHDRAVCGLRDEDYLKICGACRIREKVTVDLSHEIAHIAFGTFSPDLDRSFLEDNEYFSHILNALEDVRVDLAMFDARAGMRPMMQADVLSSFQEYEGGFASKPLVAQITVALYFSGARYDKWKQWFCNKVVTDIDDVQVQQMLAFAARARDVTQIGALVVPMYNRLVELGYFEEKVPQPEPEQPEENANEPDAERADEPEDSQSEDGEGDTSDSVPGGSSESSGMDQDSDESGPSDDVGTGDASGELDAGGDPEGGDVQPEHGDGVGSDQEDDRLGDQEDSSDLGSGSGLEDQEPGSAAVPTDVPDSDDGCTEDDPADSLQQVEGADDEPEHGGGSEQPGSGNAERPEEDQEDQGEGGSVESSRDQVDGPGEDGDDRGGNSPGSLMGESGADAGSDRSDYDSSDSDEDAGTERQDQSDGGLPEAGDESEEVPAEVNERDEGSGSAEEDAGPGGNGARSGDGAGEPGHDEVSPEDSTEEEGDQDLQEAVETQPGEGVEVDFTPSMGQSSDIAEAMEHIHNSEFNEAGRSETPREGQDEKDALAVTVAIIQGEYFETPSLGVASVREVEYENSTEGWAGDMSRESRMRRGVDADLDIPNSVLGPALLKTRRIFTDNQAKNKTPNLKSGRVDSRVLGRRAWNGADERLFARRSEPGKKDYSVMIMMDISSSNAGTNLALLKRSVMAQAMLCAKVGVDFAITAHSGVAVAIGPQNYSFELVLHHIKHWSDPWDGSTIRKMHDLNCLNGNLDGHAMEYGRKQLARRSSSEKIMLYYTDGKMPAANHDEELEVLTNQIRKCRNDGITLLGVGIDTDSPMQHGLDTVMVTGDDDLKTVVDHLGKRLSARNR